MNIGLCMKRKVISISAEASARTAAITLANNHIGTLPVVDDENKLIGFVRMRDLINLAMPDFIKLVEQFDFVPDFGAAEDQPLEPGVFEIPISQIMNPPVSVEETSGLLRAAALLQNHQMTDLPVIDRESHLVGIISYPDIGIALISNWNLSK